MVTAVTFRLRWEGQPLSPWCSRATSRALGTDFDVGDLSLAARQELTGVTAPDVRVFQMPGSQRRWASVSASTPAPADTAPPAGVEEPVRPLPATAKFTNIMLGVPDQAYWRRPPFPFAR